MTIGLLPETALSFILIFARLGTMLMLVPAFGSRSVSTRLRLGFALLFSFVMFPVVSQSLPALPASMLGVLALLGHEILVGLFIGGMAWLAVFAAQVAGTIIAFQIGLAFANSVDPLSGTQGVVVGTFLSIVSMTLIFVTDLHHILLAVLYESYRLFVPGSVLPISDVVTTALDFVVKGFALGVQLAAPFIVLGLVFYLGVGVLARMLPQIQVFFLAIPASILVGMIVFMFVLASMMMWYIDYVRAAFMMLMGG